MSSIRNDSKADLQIVPSEISMLADDLAGACDTGIEFLGSLGQVTVMVDSDDPELETDILEGLVVWNTESRDLSANDAYEKVKRASRVAAKGEKRVFFKKTDSAFRGNFGHEIAAVMDALNLKVCCLAPAIPEFGRVARNGIQYLDGKPISESFYRKDPRHPVTESNVSKVATIGNDRPIGLLTLDTLRSRDSEKQFERLMASGAEVIVVDGEIQEDLNQTVDLFLRLTRRMVFVGGQDLGHAVARHCSPGSIRGQWTKIPEGPIIVVCGTLHPKSREQIRVLSTAYDIDPVFIEPGVNNDAENIKSTAEKASNNILNQLKNSEFGLLTSPENASLNPDVVEQSIARTIQNICRKTKLSGLILTGGTTAYTVCQKIGVKRV